MENTYVEIINGNYKGALGIVDGWLEMEPGQDVLLEEDRWQSVPPTIRNDYLKKLTEKKYQARIIEKNIQYVFEVIWNEIGYDLIDASDNGSWISGVLLREVCCDRFQDYITGGSPNINFTAEMRDKMLAYWKEAKWTKHKSLAKEAFPDRKYSA